MIVLHWFWFLKMIVLKYLTWLLRFWHPIKLWTREFRHLPHPRQGLYYTKGPRDMPGLHDSLRGNAGEGAASPVLRGHYSPSVVHEGWGQAPVICGCFAGTHSHHCPSGPSPSCPFHPRGLPRQVHAGRKTGHTSCRTDNVKESTTPRRYHTSLFLSHFSLNRP